MGKRVMMLKRPAVLCAAAFVVGVVFVRWGNDRFLWSVPVLAAGMFAICGWILHCLRSGRRAVSMVDKLLILVPVFFLAGALVMRNESVTYEKYAENFGECMIAGRDVLAEGTIREIHRTKTGVRLELEDAVTAPYAGEEPAYRFVGNLLVYADGIQAENGELKYGQRIFVYGSGSTFEEAANPGGFDAKTHYFSLGITGAIHGKTIRIQSFSYHRLHQALFQAKDKLMESYVTYLGEEGAGVISSMLLGERAYLSEETKELYRHGGISHILAISGLHVSMIGMALYSFLRKTVLGRNGAIPVACAGVILYGTFVEAGTSTKRAVIMFLLLLLATALGRTYDTLSAMAVSMIVILWGSPGALYTPSFQLSYAAAYGASVLAVLLKERREEDGQELMERSKRWGVSGEAKQPQNMGERKEPKWVEAAKGVAKTENRKWFRLWEYGKEKGKSMFLFGLAIQAVSFPFTVYHFFEYPTYGFLLNPMVVPLMTLLLLCGLLSGVCGLFSPWLGYFFAGGTGGILWIYDTLCRWVKELPASLLLPGKPAVWQMGVYFLGLVLILVLWQGRRRKRVRSAKGREPGVMHAKRSKQGVMRNVVLLLLLVLPLCLLPLPGAKLETAFLDVGQGDGIVLRERGGAVMMIDGGSTSIQSVGEKRIIPYLKSQGIRVIDCAFVSHTDSDHISGLKEILEAMPVYSEYRAGTLGYTGTPVVKCIVLPELYREGREDQTYFELVELAKEKNVEVCFMAAGDRMRVGDTLVFSCLAPEPGVVYGDKNAASMVLVASYGAFDMLLTGDMDRAGEVGILNGGRLYSGDGETKGDGTIEVLKVAHHGSRTASSEAFITALSPEIAVISCGKNNRYGHPHKETLDTLYRENSVVYRTDESGCVTIEVGKKGNFRVNN